VEPDGREAAGNAAAGVSRGQNVVYVIPHDWASIAHFMGPLFDRIDPALSQIQLVVLTPDAEVAAEVAAATVRLSADRGIEVMAATSVGRAKRLLKMRAVHVLTGTPATLVSLIHDAALKLEHVRAAAVAWADELLVLGGESALETFMTELPKDGPRIVVAATLTPEVETLIERYARRARRVVSPLSEGDQSTTIDYVSVSPTSRLSALVRLLDALDPPSALVFVRDEVSEERVRDLLRSLGYSSADSPVRTGKVAEPGTGLVVLYDLPASREELRETVGAEPRRVVALAQPRQLANLRVLAAQGAVKPLALPGAANLARDRDTAMRGELQNVLAGGEFGRELLALEPLLEEYDGIEIAAAAVRLLERERSKPVVPTPEPPASAAAMVRLFVNVGSRDNVRPGDLVGAITNQTGITSADIGKIDVRESHSLVEVASKKATNVVEKLTGTSIRGRRAVARVDTDRPSREGGRETGSRGAGSRGAGSRGPGGRGPGERGADRFRRGDQPSRSPTRRRDRE
jgi:ATP-dependent RNA helicase DeaD